MNKNKEEKYLWEHFYKKEDLNIKIPNKSLYDYMIDNTKEYKDIDAINYFGKKITFKDFWNYIDLCAKALKSFGVREKDVVTICMPNTPEAVISFFAINKIGAISNMIHPLSGEEEIKEYLNTTNSTFLILFNSVYPKVRNIIKDTKVYKVVIASASDGMPLFLNRLYNITKERKEEKPKNNSLYIFWKDFIKNGYSYDGNTSFPTNKEDDAVILHSGGTTGIPKSIVLPNRCFTGVLEQSKICFYKVKPKDTLLSVLPMFHCFGLVVCIYVPICLGLTAILIPSFDAKRFDKLLTKYEPNVISGVPTLYEALLTNEHMDGVDLSKVKYLMSGGDTLPIQKNKEVNEFLKKHGCKETVTQGYGMTETTGPVTFGSMGSDKLGSVGAPLPGNIVKICDPETFKELKPNEKGEICISSFVTMKGYLNNESATKEVFKLHDDGKYYIHTGDIGYLDEDGVLFYVSRIKRIIVSSGYNVYPQYIENTLRELDFIKDACVVGIPHPYKVEIPIAFIKLKDDIKLSYTIRKKIMDHVKKKLSHFMIPKDYIFKSEFPKTKLGKTDYNELQKEAINNKNK